MVSIRLQRRLPLFAMAVLVVIYLATTLPNLANDPIVGADEGWIISSAAKLSTDGVFGTDLFRGFYDAEDHYYFNLPLYHFAVAASFEVLGIGVAEARLVSVVFGLAALLLTYFLGRSLGGVALGVLSAALFLLLRLNLTPFTGLTLTDLGATVRYDLAAVPFVLGAALLLNRRPESPSVTAVAASGLLIGLACLTQFIGALAALPAAAFLLTLALPFARRLVLVAVLGLAALLPFLPYGAYLAADWHDFRGQSDTVLQQRDFLSPAFYFDQLVNEADRYNLGLGFDGFPNSPGELLRRPSARLALLVVGPIAAVYALWRGRYDPARRLLAFFLAGMALQLPLFESTKFFVYWVAVQPFFCIAIADLACALWCWRPRNVLPTAPSTPLVLREPQDERIGLHLLPRIVVGGVLALFLLEGLAVAVKDVREAPDAPNYAAFGERLKAVVPEDAVVIGDNRLWPALRDRDLHSLLLLFYYTNPKSAEDGATDIAGAIDRTGAGYLLLSPASRDFLRRLSPEHRAELDRFLAERAELVETVAYPVYGPLEVYRVRR